MRLGLVIALHLVIATASAAPPAATRAGATAPIGIEARAESLFQSVDSLLKRGQAEQAVVALREGLALMPGQVDARLRLANLLIEQGRHGEALPEAQAALRPRPDIPAYDALLRAQRGAGSAIALAMAAEDAATRHPAHVPFIQAAIEALLAVKAADLALKYWQRLPKADQNAPRGQALLGAIHEANGSLAQAWRAYQVAAATEAQAKAALERLATQSLALDGRRYFPPPGWSLPPGTPLPGTPAQLIDTHSGARATLILMAKAKPDQALLQMLSQRLPMVPPDYLDVRLKAEKRKPTKPSSNSPSPGMSAPEFLQVKWLDCPGLICLEAGPDKEYAQLFSTLHAGAYDLRPGTLVILLEGARREQMQTAFKTLFAPANLIVDGGKP
ncbi:MAG: tetratricopeptide repeat protein [Pseudomonadota bacterium]|nr:tetratricopeptide repeat protein [Pseudomonadota bacterium]